MPQRRGSALTRWLPAAVAVAFVIALAAWTLTGRTPADDVDAAPHNSASSLAGTHGTQPRNTSTGSAGTASSTGAIGPGGFPTDFPLNGGTGANVHGGAQHAVTLIATSDSSILRLLYYVQDGAQGKSTEVRSPVRVRTKGRGDSGPIAEIWMQASVYATVVRCSISIDGEVRSVQVAHGPHNVAICIA